MANFCTIDSISSSGFKQPYLEESQKKFDKILAFVKGHDAFDTGKFIEQFGKSDSGMLPKLTTENGACHPKLLEMFQHIHATSNFVTKTLALSGAWHHDLKFIPLELTECACHNGAFNRLTSPRRNTLENALVRRLSDSTPDKNEPLHLLSLGSGGLMADFFTLEKLVLAGFKKISIDCVDPIGIKEDRIQRIKKFFEGYPEVTIEIKAYSNIEEVPKEKTGYSAILAIDYDDLGGVSTGTRNLSTGDLIKAYDRLGQTGFVCLGFGKVDDTLFGPSMDPVMLGNEPALMHLLSSDLEKQLPQKEELVVGFEVLNNLTALSLALAIRKSGIQYSKISFSCFSSKDEWFNSNQIRDGFSSIAEAILPHATVEFTLGEHNKKCDLMFIKAESEEYQSKKYLSLLNQPSTAYVDNSKGKLVRHHFGTSLSNFGTSLSKIIKY